MVGEQVEGFYDGIAEIYDAQRFARPYCRQVDRLERAYVLGKVGLGTSVLEIGPGTGRFTAHLVGKVARVTAVDVSGRMLEQLRDRVSSARLAVQQLSVYDLDVLAGYGSFDTVICMRVLPHLENPAIALRLLSRAVKPGGNAVFDLWNPYSFIGLIRKLFRRPSRVPTKLYPYRRMLQMIEASGLTVEDELAWGYPRIGAFSLDFLGNLVLKPFGYSLIFNTIRSHAVL
jgi:SAM-dependent methyltransferase